MPVKSAECCYYVSFPINHGPINKFYITWLLIFLCVCIVICFSVSKSFVSTSQIGKIIDKIGMQLKGLIIELFMFNVKYSHSLLTKLRHITLATLVTLVLKIYKIQSANIYFILPFVARYSHCRVDTDNRLPTSPTHPSSLSYSNKISKSFIMGCMYFRKGGERYCEFHFHLCAWFF